jgi:uncharacterized protein (DUF2235 family)
MDHFHGDIVITDLSEDIGVKVDSAASSQPDEKMPCGHKVGGRNLIVCIDGTMNKFGKKVHTASLFPCS